MQPAPVHDRYDILRPLARGGMAMVHLAREVDTGREVALKHLVVPEGQRVPEWRLRFQQEFHLAARLRHPHVVATYDYAEPREGLPFFTMEYLPGPGFEELIPMAPDRLLAVLPGLLSGLAYLHDQGLVHGDLKPDNIRLAADGSARVMDLGLVTRAGQPAPGIQGTLPYLAPEVIRRAAADRRSDLYALGAVLYHQLAGRPPFQGDHRAVLSGHLEQAPQALGELVPGVPRDLEQLVMRMLAKDPLERFQSAGEALRFLGAEADRADDQTLFHPPLVGRQAELKALQEALKRTRGEGYQEVWIHGEPDAGLAAVLEEFCCRGQLLGAQVLRGAFRPRMAPFEGMRGILRGLVALARSRPAELAKALPVVAWVDPELGPAADAAEVDPQQELLRLHDAFTQLVSLAAATGPVVLAFDDGHLADPSWRDWLAYLQRNAAGLPVMVVATHVGEPTLDFDPCRVDVPIGPASESETAELCRAVLGQAELPLAFTHQVHALSGGLPQRVEQLLRRLAASTRLRRAEGAWCFPDEPIEAVLAASAPQWAVAAAAKALPSLAGALLEALAVLGREAELLLLWGVARRLAAPGDQPPAADAAPDASQSAELFEALRVLEVGDWVVGRDGRYGLHPERPLDAVSEVMDPPRRRAVHGAVADTLADLLAQAPGDVALAAEVARHALGAGDRARGPAFALAAAGRQARLFGLEEAEALLKDAVALLEAEPAADARTLMPFCRLRADVARLAGDRRLAEATYQQTLHLAALLGDVEEQAHALVGYGRLKLAAGDLAAAGEYLESVLSLLASAAVHPEKAEALTQLGRRALTHGDLAEARRWVEQALAMARQGGYRGLIRENMAQLGYLYVAGGEERAAEGLGLLFEALQLIEQDEAKIELNACHALLGNALLLLGRYAEAKQAFQRNCDLCAEIGAAPHDEATAFMRRTQVALEVGDYREARQSAKPAGALARMVGNKLLLAQVRLLEGLAALFQGDYTLWQDAAGQMEETVAALGSDNLKAMWLSTRAEAEAFLGQGTAALSSANAALEVIARGAGHEFRERAQILKAEALTRMGLARPARQALEAVSRPRNEALQARLLLAQASIERIDGKAGQALQLSRRALELARRTGALPTEAACCLLLARLSPDREEATRLGRQALLHAELCGHPALQAETLGLLAGASGRTEQAEWFLQAASEAWRHAVAQLPPSIAEGFGAVEERRPLREALARRVAEGYRPTPDEYRHLLALLSEPPTLDRLVPGIARLARELAGCERVAVFWEDHRGAPVLVGGEGAPFGGVEGPAELEAAQEAGAGTLMLPLVTGGEPGDAPWGALLVAGLAPEGVDRLEALLAYVGGPLWAARRLWLAAHPPAPLVDVPL